MSPWCLFRFMGSMFFLKMAFCGIHSEETVFFPYNLCICYYSSQYLEWSFRGCSSSHWNLITHDANPSVTQLGGKGLYFLFWFLLLWQSSRKTVAVVGPRRWLGRGSGKHGAIFSSLSRDVHVLPPQTGSLELQTHRSWFCLWADMESFFPQPRDQKPKAIVSDPSVVRDLAWGRHQCLGWGGDMPPWPACPTKGPFCCHHSIDQVHPPWLKLFLILHFFKYNLYHTCTHFLPLTASCLFSHVLSVKTKVLKSFVGGWSFDSLSENLGVHPY